MCSSGGRFTDQVNDEKHAKPKHQHALEKGHINLRSKPSLTCHTQRLFSVLLCILPSPPPRLTDRRSERLLSLVKSGLLFEGVQLGGRGVRKVNDGRGCVRRLSVHVSHVDAAPGGVSRRRRRHRVEHVGEVGRGTGRQRAAHHPMRRTWRLRRYGMLLNECWFLDDG